MKESKSMMRKELSFMKKKGAPKSMIKHEEAEMEGKKVRKFAEGGFGAGRAAADARLAAARAKRDRLNPELKAKLEAVRAANDAKIAANRQARDAGRPIPSAPPVPPPSSAPAPLAPPPKLSMPPPGGLPDNTQAMMRKGGAVKKYARGGGIESKGKTRGHIVKMASGGHVGSASKRADGCATKGKTKGRMV